MKNYTSVVNKLLPGRGRLLSLPALPFLIAVLIIAPILVVASTLLTPTWDIWQHLWENLLPEMMRNTALLLIGVGVGTFVIGAGLAWLVVAYRFPGQSVFEWLLILPLVIPTYIMGFIYMSTFDFAGPVQTFLRQWLGSSDWFPEIRSGAGAVLVMTLALYPYVYMLAKAGFQGLSSTAYEAARVMGMGPGKFLLRIALPLARPAIAGGVALALMETLADFATVRYFNFPTLSEGVVRVWNGMMDLDAARELAGLLAMVALVLILFETTLRGRSRYYQTGGKSPGIPRTQLVGWRKWGATALCTMVVAVAFGLPVLQLVLWASEEITAMPEGTIEVYTALIMNSILLAGLASLFAVIAALVMASGVRITGGKLVKFLARAATIGYAMPGAVIAVGILLTVTTLDNSLNTLIEQYWEGGLGLLITGSIIGLVYGYVVRYMAVAYNSIDAGMEKMTPNLTLAARILRASRWRIMWRIHLPLVAPGIFAGAALVFVDVMKELPITVMLRPFGYDTLAVWVWQMAAESMWSGAALPALTILLVGLIPVIYLTRISAGK
ncbi:MAG: iron ABC transporter permease [Clostridia bacterium]|nr:iron ABC transporter permease [Clostridia bacterium]